MTHTCAQCLCVPVFSLSVPSECTVACAPNVYVFYLVFQCFDKYLCKMFMSYEVFATFGISAILSFTLSVTLLLIIAAKRGHLRVGARNKPAKFNPLLLPSAPPLTTKIVEMTPLKDPRAI